MSALALLPAALRGLRHRPVGALAPVAAVAFAVAAVLVSVSVLIGVSEHESPGPVRYRAADVVVGVRPAIEISTPEGSSTSFTPPDPALLSAADLAALAALPGVAAVVPDQASRGDLTGPSGSVARDDEAVVVRGWSALRLAGTDPVAGSPPADGEVAVPTGRGLAVGDEATLTTRDGVTSVRVSALLPEPETEGEVSVLVPDPVAARLADGAMVAGLFTTPEWDGEAVAGFRSDSIPADRLLVLTGADRGRAEVDHRARVLADTSAVAGVVLGVSGFVAVFTTANTLALGVARRRREFAMVRLVGATRRQVRLSVIAEALVVSAAGSLLGLLIGSWLAPVFTAVLTGAGLAPAGFRPVVSPLAVTVSTASAAGIGLVASYGAARRASRIRPVTAAAEAGVDRRGAGPLRIALGVLCLAATVAVTLVLPSGLDVVTASAIVLSWLALIGVAALGPWLVPRLASFLLRVAERVRPGPLAELPRAGARRAVKRTTATALPVAVTVGLAATMLGLAGMAGQASAREAAALVTADAVVLAGPSGTLPADSVQAVRDLPGVAAAVPVRSSEIVAGSPSDTYERTAWQVSTDELGEVLDVPLVDGDLTALGPGTIALAEPLAHSMGNLRVGDTARFWGPDGRRTKARVVAILDLPMLSVEALLPLEGKDPDRVLVALDPASGDTAAAELGELAARHGADTVSSGDLEGPVADAQADSNRAVLRIILAIAVLLGAVTLVHTVLMSVEDRRHEVAVLRLLGAEPSHVHRWLLAESAGAVGAGLTLGLGVYVFIGVSALANQPALGPLPLPVVEVWLVGAGLATVALVSTAWAAAALLRRPSGSRIQ